MTYHRRVEESIQMAVADYLRLKYPKVIFTICPDPYYKKYQRLGYRKGTPDILIFKVKISKPLQRVYNMNYVYATVCSDRVYYVTIYGGLFLELKTDRNARLKIKKGVESDAQIQLHKGLIEEGYKVVTCYGVKEEIKEIDEYMK